MELREDEPFVLEIDRQMVESVDRILACLALTEDYADSTREETEQELLCCLFELWVDAEFYALSNLTDVLSEHTHIEQIERDAHLLEKMGVMEGPEFRETRRSIDYLREVLLNNHDQVVYERIRLNRHGRTITVFVVHEQI